MSLRFLFMLIGNSRRSNYLNGDTIRDGGAGCSGTDSSFILVAEYLVQAGHDVTVCVDILERPLIEKLETSGKFFVPGSKCSRGVCYTNLQMDGIDHSNRVYDILVTSLWFQDYVKLTKFYNVSIKRALIYWCHMQWIYGIDDMILFTKNHNLSLGFVHISQWETLCNESVILNVKSSIKNVLETRIPNPIMTDIIKDVQNEQGLQRKPHKVVFHASWGRGGNIAVKAVREMTSWNDVEFHAFDYLMTIHDHKDPWFKLHDGVDKKTLFRHLCEAEYFVYPLYTPYEDVHKDTFSCVVAEAIACGATVLTYPLGAVPEYFSDYCVWIDMPEGTNIDIIQSQSLTKDYEGKFKQTQPIVQKLQWLEENSAFKQDRRNTGLSYIHNAFSIETIGPMWTSFIESLMDLQVQN